MMTDSKTLPEDRLLSSREAAEFLGVSRQTLYVLHNAGEFPAVVISRGMTNWRLTDLRAFIESRTRRIRSG
jgi:excisionase family DNA binding protein